MTPTEVSRWQRWHVELFVVPLVYFVRFDLVSFQRSQLPGFGLNYLALREVLNSLNVKQKFKQRKCYVVIGVESAWKKNILLPLKCDHSRVELGPPIHFKLFSLRQISYFGQRGSSRFNGNFAVVGDRRRDLDRLARHVGSLVQAHLTLHHTRAQAHGFGQLVIDVAAKRFLQYNTMRNAR